GGDVTAVLLDSGETRWWGDGDPNPRIPWTGATVMPTGYRPTGPLVPTITTQIPTPADVSTDPPVVGANLLLAAIAMIAFTIAIELLNRTLAQAEPVLRRRVGPLSRLDRARARVDEALSGRLGRGRAADAARVVGIAAFYGLVFALLDPTWEPLSVTGLWLVLSFAVACGLVGIADDVATWATARRWGVASEMGVRPGSLLAALASTVATRALVLVPWVMIGTPEALDVDEERLDRPRRGRLAAMGLGAVGVVGALAWLATLVAAPLASSVPGAATIVRGLEAFLLLVFAVAVQNGFVQLLAFRDSAGRALFHVSRVAWGVALLVVTFLFWHTLVNPRGDLAEALEATNVQAFMATVGVVLAVAAGAWLVAFVARRRSSAGATAEAPADEVAAAGEAPDPDAGPAEPAPAVAIASVAAARPVAIEPPASPSAAPAPAPAAPAPATAASAPSAADAIAAGHPGDGVSTHALHVPGNRRLAGPARLAISPDRLELDGGWVDLAADRLAAVVTTVIVIGLVVPAVPIVVAAADGRFHPERVPWLPEAMILVPALAVIALFLVRRWRDGRRLPRLTACPCVAAEARSTVDRDSTVLAGLVGSSSAVVAWLVGSTDLVLVAAGIGGAMVGAGLYLAVAGRTMLVVRAPLDPERRGSVVLSMKARDREAATDIVAAIREARERASGSPEMAR
ncbi:MAG: hypothetical protein MUC54_08750, partial [Chloroflexi bacterium]|nr:hypothetical protein [Chloroflexota bacterium]